MRTRGRKSGWKGAAGLRVDPTAVVEPDRLTRGMLDLLPDAGSTGRRAWSALRRRCRALLQRWDAVNTWWNDHVLKFDYHSQLISWPPGYPLAGPADVGLGFVAALLSWLGWIAWHLGRGAPRRAARPVGAGLRAVVSGSWRAPGCRVRATKGRLAYADVSWAKRTAGLARRCERLLARYAELRYGAPPDQSAATNRN